MLRPPLLPRALVCAGLLALAACGGDPVAPPTDVDHDGHLAVSAGGDDCNDADPAVFPGATEVPYDGVDQDCSGADLDDVDGDGAKGGTGGADCDDAKAEVHPGAEEACNGVDDDCDGEIDDGVKTTFYADTDGDGFGDAAKSVLACAAPAGYVADATDCDDAQSAIHPGAQEICDAADVDEDCDGSADDADQDAQESSKTRFFPDADGDGHGDAAHAGQLFCNDPSTTTAAWTLTHDDCDDAHAEVLPGAAEVCNGVDDDCDGETDEDVKSTFFADADGDEHGDAASSVLACAAPAGYVTTQDDCNDTDPMMFPGASEQCDGKDNDCDGETDEDVKLPFYADADGDGFGDPAQGALACAAPAGFVVDRTDCDDSKSAVHPGATESCNGLDDDCDGETDEDVKSTFYADTDGDQHGDAAASVLACTAPEGYVASHDDCNDADAVVYTGATEQCDGKDNDCDGETDEDVKSTFFADSDADGFGDASKSTLACSAPTGYVTDKTDCDDAKSAVHPGAAESCNGVDDDCDGTIDEDVKSTFFADSDADGFGDATKSVLACVKPTGYVADKTDCNDADAVMYPGASEQCDGKDNDCNGEIDEGVKSTFYADTDADGFGDAASPTLACAKPTGYVTDNTDCNDAAGTVHPGASETCNSVDDDCDGEIDEGVKLTFYRDADADTYGDPATSVQRCTALSGYVSNHDDCNDGDAQQYPGRAELCDGKDNDCNGTVDNDNPGGGQNCSTGKQGICAAGTTVCSGGALSCSQTNQPTNETCDGKDNDCNGVVDNGNPGGGVSCSTGKQGVCAAGTTACSGGAVVCEQNVQPTAESCDGKDNDCNGVVDNGNPGGGQSCFTGNQGICAAGTTVCSNGALSCSQTNQPTNEVCDGKDNDCNGMVDNGNPGGGQSCSTGRPGICAAGTTACSGSALTCGQNVQATTEIANNLDDDCDGQVDEGVFFRSCLDMRDNFVGSLTSGVYTIDPDGSGPTAPFSVYCDHSSGDAGWTLVLKANGNTTTFSYWTEHWTSPTTVSATSTALDTTEAKFDSFNTVGFTQLRVTMIDGGTPRSVTLAKSAPSLLAVTSSGSYQATALGRDRWKSLMASPSLQPYCNLEGFNVQCGGDTRIRIGITSNQENDCGSCDSRIGVGGDGTYCGQDWSNSVGNEAMCTPDNGERHTKSFAYVWVR